MYERVYVLFKSATILSVLNYFSNIGDKLFLRKNIRETVREACGSQKGRKNT